MRFGILGPIEVTEDGATMTPRPQKIRILLARLLVGHNSVVSTNALISDLWGENPPRTALQALRVYISQIRHMLARSDGAEPPAELMTQPPGYRLKIRTEALDVMEFERLYDLGRRAADRGCHETAAEHLHGALALWRGPALLDVRKTATLEAAAVRLEEQWIAAVNRRVDVDLRLRRHQDVVAELRGLTASHPFNEGLHARLMVALYRSGRTSEALNVYRGLREALVDELGVEPHQQLQLVHQAVLTADHQTLEHHDLWTL
jgi:SARP family transcriptional regulator, regulator of embCAB operon